MHSLSGFELVEHCERCTLKSERFFCNFNPNDRKSFEAIKHTTAYPEGAVLFVEGESPRGVFLLCKGRIKLSITSSEGKTLILRIAGPGEIVGLNAAVSGNAYQATAETLEPCQVNFVRREDFVRFLRAHPQAAINAGQQLSSNYQAACGRLRSLGLSRSAPERLARFLVEWSGKGRETPEGIRVKLTLTQEEIGQIIGTSRETVSRMFADFRNNHLAELRGSTLWIENKPGLEKIMST